MSGRYDSLARNHGLPLHQLPDRPSTDQLIRRAVQDEGPRIVDKLLNSSTYLLIRLGNEALAVAAQLLTGDLPDRLSPNEDSGRRHHAALRGRTLAFLPLVHPRQTVSPLETDARAVDAQHVLPLNGPMRDSGRPGGGTAGTAAARAGARAAAEHGQPGGSRRASGGTSARGPRQVSGSRGRRSGGRTEPLCPSPPARPAYQLPAARNRSTTLCGMRPRGETSILFALAHTRTAWAL